MSNLIMREHELTSKFLAMFYRPSPSLALSYHLNLNQNLSQL